MISKKAEVIRYGLNILIHNSEGKEKLKSEIALLSVDSIEISRKILDTNPESLTEDQFGIIKDSYNSIQAEFQKILGILE